MVITKHHLTVLASTQNDSTTPPQPGEVTEVLMTFYGTIYVHKYVDSGECPIVGEFLYPPPKYHKFNKYYWDTSGDESRGGPLRLDDKFDELKKIIDEHQGQFKRIELTWDEGYRYYRIVGVKDESDEQFAVRVKAIQAKERRKQERELEELKWRQLVLSEQKVVSEPRESEPLHRIDIMVNVCAASGDWTVEAKSYTDYESSESKPFGVVSSKMTENEAMKYADVWVDEIHRSEQVQGFVSIIVNGSEVVTWNINLYD